MRQTAVVAAVVLAVGAGWMGVSWIFGQEAQAPSAPAPAAPSAPAPPAPPAPSAPAVPAPVARPAPSAPAAPVAKATPQGTEKGPPAPMAKPVAAGSAKPEAAGMVAPPPPVPDVEIPPIPEVGDNPFMPGPPPVRKKKPDTIEEGKRIFDREGRVEVDPLGRPLFIFDSGEKPMPILENTVREMLESATDHGKRKTRWRVSGLVTVYEGKNFVLITRATRILPEEENL
ncbi:MAG: hypothetical protein NTX87_10835 [Planctomycetota bacterium]|nr:hypothetical protein [Planctomycetota bacterium]